MDKSLTAFCLVALAAACGGGGGGGTSTSGTPPPPASLEVPFMSFQAIQPRQTVVMSGMSQSASGSGITTVTSLAVAPLDTANTSAKLNFDDAIALSGASLVTPQANLSLSTAAGDTVTCSGQICDLFNASREIAVMNAPANGWNYQTFGVWQTGITSGNFQVGAFSIGAPTPASAIPTSSSALFTGLATGYYVDPSGKPYATAASMAASADFAARSISFATANTTRADLATATPVPDGGLNMTGTLTYAAGSNQFSGAVSTAGSGTTPVLNGGATGRFYGPSAQELGGLYNLSGGGASMLGAFGGKRP